MDEEVPVRWSLGSSADFMVPTNIVHIVVGLGRCTWDRTNKKLGEKLKNSTPQQVLGRIQKSTKTKMNALARSTDFRRSLDVFSYNKSSEIRRLGDQFGFYHSALITV